MSPWTESRHQIAIAGKVTCARTGKAVCGARVVANGAAGSGVTRTASDGLFFFVDLPNGHYKVQVSVPGAVNRYATAEGDAEVSRDAAGRIHRGTIEIALESTTVKGKITPSGHKTGLAMAEVRMKGSGERVFSDAQGQYVLTGIEPGSRTVLAYAQGYAEASRPVKLKGPGSTETVNFSLVPEAG